MHRRPVALHERILGRDDPTTLLAAWRIAYFFDEADRFKEAEKEYLKVAQDMPRVIPEDHE